MNREEYYTTGWLKANGFLKIQLVPGLGILADSVHKKMLILTNAIDFQKSTKMAEKLNRELWSVKVDRNNNINWNQLKEEKHDTYKPSVVQYALV